MTETIQVQVGDPYAAMLDQLRTAGDSDPDADIRRIVEDAIHSGFQQLEAE